MTDGVDKRESQGWTLWKEIVGTFVAVAPFAIMFAVWMSNITARVMVLETQTQAQIIAQAAVDKRQDDERMATMNRIEQRLNSLNDFMMTRK